MSSIFCCSNTQSYNNRTLSHEPKFRTFMDWAVYPKDSSITTGTAPNAASVDLAIQIVKQVNYGPLENKRYFLKTSDGDGEFIEVTEQWLIDANFEKLNIFKNYECATHNRFFEVNVYEKNPVNAHHWRANIARPATQIDL
ncbi:hypothetical protein CC86DRAFT_282155 [Ophiobolus disseminans]|uniref:Uncharacterized protein n=1 Tax=Ophiobolus disseminans TaxID=1469910 RepID=A0A6A7AF15_9PLEO|nr:hypothetical protein CC86DRAFT_282155 [Ophiobolus disseminans]